MKSSELAVKYIEAIEIEEREFLRDLLHPQRRPEGLPDDFKWETSNYAQFLLLLGFSKEEIDLQKISNEYKSGDEFLIHLQRLRSITSDWQIHEFVADDDRVWIERSYIVKDPKMVEPRLNAILMLELKDGKIYRSAANLRFFNTLRQIGQVIMKRNIKGQMQEYIKYLTHTGLLLESQEHTK